MNNIRKKKSILLTFITERIFYINYDNSIFVMGRIHMVYDTFGLKSYAHLQDFVIHLEYMYTCTFDNSV